ncbi:MAG: putative CtpA-like serine protease [Crocinitomicaceae bacterium]|nr:MAG: putative CtpA-like serine protease [Crocinitomicaceae bacterium]
MKIKKLKVLFLLPIVFLMTSSQKTDPDYFEISKNLKLVASVYEKINNYYVDEILPGRVMKKGIDAMLKSLDPYTVYISEAQIEDFRFTTTGEYGGIGASIKKRNNKTLISELYENSPAQKSGLLPGDEIKTIDEIEVNNKTLEEIGSLLKGPAESIINLKINRNNQLLEKPVKREKIQIPAVNFYKKINSNTGIIKLTSFTNTASAEFKKALSSLQQEKIENLVIDLRANGGGLLNEAVKIVNFFIPKGQEVVSTKSRIKEMNRSYTTQALPIAQELSLVVLVDEYSASASEIVAGSLQDLDQAIVIGNTSFGKGLVQQTKPVSFGGQIKLTVAKYYTPSGRCIQKLDYSTVQGSSQKIEDSLVKKFKTKNGRTVYDSRGIEPDIKIEPQYFNAVTQNLLVKDVIFDFVNDNINYYKKDSLFPESFVLSDTAYSTFMTYAINKKMDYQTESSQQLKEFVKIAKKEKYVEENEGVFTLLDSIFKVDLSKDLKKHDKEIKFFLENEFISRKHFQKGRMEASVKQDPYIEQAIGVFKNTTKYNQILGIN